MRRDATVITLVSLGHCMSHFYQLLLAPLFPFIKEELGVSYAALGFLVALFYTLSAVFQPLAGFVVDRYGARAVLFGGLALLTLGSLVAGLSQSYAMLALGAALSGLGNSVFHPADFAILNARVSPARLGYAFSAHGVVGYLGFALAPVFSVTLGAAFGWQLPLLVGAAMGLAVLVLLLGHRQYLEAKPEAPAGPRAAFREDARVLLAAPVVLCFLYFTLFAAALTGVQSFGVSAMLEQYRTSATLASSALTAYLVAAAAGILAGGFVAARTGRHDRVAAGGLAVNAVALLFIALSQVPVSLLPAAMALAGFASGVVAPSRDLIVRGATPPGATGRVFGFVYSGLDVGSFLTPVFYGWLLDHSLPHGVFYVVFAFTVAAIFTVLQLPVGRSRVAA